MFLQGLSATPNVVFNEKKVKNKAGARQGTDDSSSSEDDDWDYNEVYTEFKGPTGSPEERALHAAKQVLLRDKISFVLGIVIVFGTALWLGWSPSTLYMPYNALCVVLLCGRYIVYKRAKQHYYLLDFCYVANILTAAVLWMAPTFLGVPVSPMWIKVLFAFNEGPLLWSIPAMRNSLVLHSFDKLITLFIHSYPSLVLFTLRWFPNCHLQQTCGDSAAAAEAAAAFQRASLWDLAALPMAPYLVWSIGYYLKLFVFSSKIIREKGYETVYGYWMGSNHPMARMVLKAPPPLQPVAYLGMHCLLCWFSMCLTYIWWHSHAAHTAILVAVNLWSVWNGACYYFEVFAHRYVKSLGLPLKGDKQAAQAGAGKAKQR